MSINLRDQVLGWAGRIAKWAQFSSNNGFGRGYMQGPEEDQALGETAQPQPVRLLQNFGFRSVLRQGAGEGVVIAPRGGPANAIAVSVDDQQVGPTNLKEGESCQYCKVNGTRILLNENGGIQIDAATLQDIVMNGGTDSVARVGDQVQIVALGSLAIWMNQVETAINALAPGSVFPLSPSFVANPGIAIKTGADHFKA